MHVISGNTIKLTRGDALKAPLFINWGSDQFPIRFSLKKHPGFCVYLGVMEPNQSFEEAVIRKSYDKNSPMTPWGDLIVTLSSSDTECLLPGDYYYEVKLVKKNGSKVVTVIPKTKFFILD